jgi:hypothetical protein
MIFSPRVVAWPFRAFAKSSVKLVFLGPGKRKQECHISDAISQMKYGISAPENDFAKALLGCHRRLPFG